MNFSKREKLILVITIAIVISALAYNFLIEPFFKKWESINNEIILQEIALKKGLRLLGNRKDIIREYNSFAKSTRNLSKILSYIEKYALSSGVKTANIRPRPVLEKGYYKEYVIELEIEGPFSSINAFVSELIKPPLLITVKKVNLRTGAAIPSNLKGTLILSKLLI